MVIVGEAQVGGGNGQAGNKVARLVRRLVQVVVPADLMADISAHSLWKWGTTAMCDIGIVDLDVGSYMRTTP